MILLRALILAPFVFVALVGLWSRAWSGERRGLIQMGWLAVLSAAALSGYLYVVIYWPRGDGGIGTWPEP